MAGKDIEIKISYEWGVHKPEINVYKQFWGQGVVIAIVSGMFPPPPMNKETTEKLRDALTECLENW